MFNEEIFEYNHKGLHIIAKVWDLEQIDKKIVRYSAKAYMYNDEWQLVEVKYKKIYGTHEYNDENGYIYHTFAWDNYPKRLIASDVFSHFEVAKNNREPWLKNTLKTLHGDLYG